MTPTGALSTEVNVLTRRRLIDTAVAFAAAAFVAGCASEVTRTPVVFIADSKGGEPVTLAVDTLLRASTNYPRTLRAGSRWIPIGRIAQGMVLRPANDVLTVEGSNVHEAYLVVDAAYIVGLYLPVERAFSPIAERPRFLTH